MHIEGRWNYMLEFDFEMESLAQIKVIGVGGGGAATR